MLRRVRRVVSHMHIGEPVIPQVTLTGLTEDARLEQDDRPGRRVRSTAGRGWSRMHCAGFDPRH